MTSPNFSQLIATYQPVAGGGGIVAPTFISETETTWNSGGTTKTTASFAVQTGDVLVAFMMTEAAVSTGSDSTISDNTSGAITWTSRQDNPATNDNNQCYNRMWTGVADSDRAALTVSFNKTSSDQWYGGSVLVFRGSSGIGNSVENTLSTTDGAPSQALTTAHDNSAIVCSVSDWNAADGASRTWRTINSITPTSGNGGERVYFRDGSRYTVYGAYWSNVGAAGSKTLGLSAPSTMRWNLIGVEVRGT